MADLVKFILNVETLDDTKVGKYVKIACNQPSPQVYKPRKGVVNGNKDKFRPMALDFMLNYSRDLLDRFDYTSLFIAEGTVAAENYDPKITANNVKRAND